ncbi:MAG: DUF4215 domain-containing protein [Kofleriaceae bacterium]
MLRATSSIWSAALVALVVVGSGGCPGGPAAGPDGGGDAGCDGACVPLTCGDGIVQAGEACDDGNTVDGDGCDRTCTATACGNGVVTAGEACDDGNVLSHDGCSATCAVDTALPAEVEPNDDGSPSTGGTGDVGNDFGGAAASNATAQGVLRASAGRTTRIGSLTPAGDEDLFAITNDTAAEVLVSVDLWSRAAGYGIGVPCGVSADTALHLRDAQGTSLVVNDDRNGFGDHCSAATRIMAPGETIYAHVIEFNDDEPIPGYAMVVDFIPAPYRVIPLACVDMTGATTLLATGDSSSAPRAPLPFPVTLYGAPMTHFMASVNGFVGLFPTNAGQNSSLDIHPRSLPNTDPPNAFLAPFWDDLALENTGLRSNLTGAAPDQVFTVEWNATLFEAAGSNLVMQLQFHQGGRIEFHYCAGSPGTAANGPARLSGSHAMIGSENATGTIGYALAVDLAGTITPGTSAYRFVAP